MGSTVCRAVLGQQDMTLVAAVDPKMAGLDFSQVTGVKAAGVEVVGDVGVLPMLGVDVVVDFTNAEVAMKTLEFCVEHSIRCVVGTTGFSETQLAELEEAFSRVGVGAVVASNFSVGAVLMIKMAGMLSRFFDSAEIVEMHHERKMDAPSGTAIATANVISAAKVAQGESFIADPTQKQTLDGARGARVGAGVNIHSVRTVGAVAHQEVIFGSLGQSLTIRHDSYDRSSFMPGVLMAIRAVQNLSEMRQGIDWILDKELAEGVWSKESGE